MHDARNGEQYPYDPRSGISYATLLFASEPILTPVDERERRTFQQYDRQECGDIDPLTPEKGGRHTLASERVCHRSSDNHTHQHHQPSDPMTLALCLPGV